jgi:hypothetical protein
MAKQTVLNRITDSISETVATQYKGEQDEEIKQRSTITRARL